MTMTYAQFDIDACNAANLIVSLKVPDPEAGGTSVHNVKFQFPPKVTNDSRGGDWKEESAGPNSGDKIAVYTCAKPRRITLEWDYIVDGGNWDIPSIKSEVQALRGYFRNPYIETVKGINAKLKASSPLVILLQLWDIGGQSTMSFRMGDASIKHGKTLVGSVLSGSIFPLHTSVSIELLSWPKIGGTLGSSSGTPVQTVPGQKVFTQDWF